MKNEELLCGKIADGIFYTLIKSEELPINAVVTAVIGIITDSESNVYIAKNGRGWDLPGGHIEDGENVIDALKREVEEEVGTKIKGEVKLWGYKKMISDKPIPRHRGGFYHKESYIAYYEGKSDGEDFKAYGEEIIESKKLQIIEAIKLIQNEVDKLILEKKL